VRHDRSVAALTVRIDDDPARRAALSLARRLERCIGRRGRATLALSGGATAPPLIAALVDGHPAVDWSRVEVWQVDERVAPDGHPDRNVSALEGFPALVHPMPVTAGDLEVAATEYAATLPERFDVVHLGMGPDGHTASWPPGDPIVDLPPEREVALSRPYQGRVRMSLLPAPVNAARGRVALIVGADKAAALAASRSAGCGGATRSSSWTRRRPHCWRPGEARRRVLDGVRGDMAHPGDHDAAAAPR
jgi:6-phosphogluconolactonase/glucosamine-6-phosphate isomerase/deaminase